MSINDILDQILGGMTKEEAFYALLAAAMLIDGEADEREEQELAALAQRTRTLSALKPGDLQKLKEKIDPRLQKGSIDSLIADACASLRSESPAVGLAIFGHCCDIVLADRIVRNEEKIYLKTLIEKLSIDQKEAESMLHAIRAKNEH
ncbi:TerB family tellurite resistance protein [Hyphomonas sp.]|uniref:TerB family tellurite resistance protein n=1 Tax=Hyphomonas sp. TaxID=87 RepID=UPI00391A47EC